MNVLHEVDLLLDQVLHRFQHQERALHERGGNIPHRVDQFVHVEIALIAPKTDQSVALLEIDARRQQNEVLYHLLVNRREHGTQGAAHAISQEIDFIDGKPLA